MLFRHAVRHPLTACPEHCGVLDPCRPYVDRGTRARARLPVMDAADAIAMWGNQLSVDS